jgi:hypothetical protein
MKVRYDKTTGKLGQVYSEDMIIPVPFIILPEEQINEITNNKEQVAFVVDGEVVMKDKTTIETEEQQKEFLKQFFNTSLGYVKRKVTMVNGDVKDFLFDIKPTLSVGNPIITYNIDKTQNRGVLVTEEFLNECNTQIYKDFYGVNP